MDGRGRDAHLRAQRARGRDGRAVLRRRGGGRRSVVVHAIRREVLVEGFEEAALGFDGPAPLERLLAFAVESPRLVHGAGRPKDPSVSCVTVV